MLSTEDLCWQALPGTRVQAPGPLRHVLINFTQPLGVFWRVLRGWSFQAVHVADLRRRTLMGIVEFNFEIHVHAFSRVLQITERSRAAKSFHASVAASVVALLEYQQRQAASLPVGQEHS